MLQLLSKKNRSYKRGKVSCLRHLGRSTMHCFVFLMRNSLTNFTQITFSLVEILAWIHPLNFFLIVRLEANFLDENYDLERKYFIVSLLPPQRLKENHHKWKTPAFFFLLVPLSFMMISKSFLKVRLLRYFKYHYGCLLANDSRDKIFSSRSCRRCKSFFTLSIC